MSRVSDSCLLNNFINNIIQDKILFKLRLGKGASTFKGPAENAHIHTLSYS